MHLNGKAGINYISRVTFIGICHVSLRVFTNTTMIAQPQQSSTVCRSQCQSKAYPISKWPAQCSSLYTIYKSTFWKSVRQCHITRFYKWQVTLQSFWKKCCHHLKRKRQAINLFPYILPSLKEEISMLL